MISEFSAKLWELLGRSDIRLHRNVSLEQLRRQSKGYVYPLIPPELILEAEQPIDYGVLNQIRDIIETYRAKADENEHLEHQNRVLNQEVNQILFLEEDYLVDEIYLGKLFSFLGKETHFCILRDRELLVRVGLADQTIDYCLRRLEHHASFSVPVRRGELYAIAADDYQAVFEAEQSFSDFAKRIISLKLNWLGSKHREKLFIQRLKYMEERYLGAQENQSGEQAELNSTTSSALREEYRKLDDELRGLMKQAITDSLTNVYNRSKINQLLEAAIKEAQRHQVLFTVIMFDIDHFKAINDTFGHLTGDRVLIGIADRTRDALRSTDILARWGGEEFVILLPDTDGEQGIRVAEKLRATICEQPFEGDIRVTSSYGVAEFRCDESANELLERADQALYQAKRQGRNRVVKAAMPTDPA